MRVPGGQFHEGGRRHEDKLREPSGAPASLSRKRNPRGSKRSSSKAVHLHPGRRGKNPGSGEGTPRGSRGEARQGVCPRSVYL